MPVNIVDLATHRQADLEIVIACAVTIAGERVLDLLQDWQPETQLEVKELWPMIKVLCHGDFNANFYRYFATTPGGFAVIRRWESTYADLVPPEFISTFDAIPWALKEMRYMKQLRWILNHLAETIKQDAEYAD
jgi:hypothetical protein